MKRFCLELLVSSISSAIGFWLITEFFWKLLGEYTCMEHVIAGVFIGLPLGSILGLSFLAKFVYKEKEFSFKSIMLGLALSLIVEILCIIFCFPTLGILSLVVLPIAVSITFILTGRNVFKLRKRQKP